jgi:hypothetical protein
LCQWRQDELDSYARIGVYSGVVQYVGSGTMKIHANGRADSEVHAPLGAAGLWVNELSSIMLRERFI